MTEVESLESELVETKKNVEEDKRKEQELVEKENEMQDREQTLLNQIHELQTQLQQAEDVNTALKANESNREELEKEKEAYLKDINVANSLIAEQTQKIDELTKEVTDCKDELSKRDHQIESMRQAQELGSQQVESLVEQLNESQ